VSLGRPACRKVDLTLTPQAADVSPHLVLTALDRMLPNDLKSSPFNP
jgi:hypothetical protein